MMRKMKDSGIAWIGEIPEEWTVVKFSSILQERKQKNVGLKEKNLLSLSYGNIVRKDISTRDGLLPESFETYNIIDNGCIVFRLTDLQNDHRSLRTGLCKERGIITSAYVTVECQLDDDPAYLHNLFRSYDECKVFYGTGDGVRQGMNYVDLKKLYVLRPPLNEQKKIARYIDDKAAIIEARIKKEAALIDRMQSYKQSLITETVTKGLHPEVARKDSGVEWIGEIPASWKMERLKFLAEVKTGPFGTQLKATEYVAEGTPCINVKNIGYGSIKSDDLDFVPPSVVKRLNEHILRPGDIVFARKGSIDKHAITTESESGWLQGSDCIRVRLQADLDHNFFNYYLANSGLKYYLASLSNGATMASLNGAMIEDLLILLPTAVEQREIASFLDTKCAAIDADIAKRRALIERLSAYKRSLIYEVVTGKREV